MPQSAAPTAKFISPTASHRETGYASLSRATALASLKREWLGWGLSCRGGERVRIFAASRRKPGPTCKPSERRKNGPRLSPGSELESVTYRFSYISYRSAAVRGAFEVEREQARQRLVLGDVGRPAIGRRHGGVEVAVRVGEPGRPLVVKMGQGAGFQGFTAHFLTGQSIIIVAATY